MSSGVELGAADDRPRTYEVVGEGAALRKTAPLAWMAMAAIAAVDIVLLLRVLASFSVKSSLNSALDAFVAGNQNASLLELDDAAHMLDRINTLDALSWAALVVAAGSLALWSRHLAKNALARGVRGINVDAATFWWLVPLVGPVFAIREIKQAVTATGYSDHHLARWLWAGYVAFGVSVFTWLVTGTSMNLATDFRETMETIDRANLVHTLELAWFLFYGWCAIVAIRHADRAVSRI